MSIRTVSSHACHPGSAGLHVTKGYFNKQRITDQIFNAQTTHGNGSSYLRTSDLGFVRNGELYVTGRIKEMIIIRGKNYYPQDIELTAQINNAVLRTGAGAAFGVELDNEEKVVLVRRLTRNFSRILIPGGFMRISGQISFAG